MRRGTIPLLCMAFCLGSGTVAWSQLIVAHRGASHDAPENTLAAFRLAWEQGADGIEGDFYFTRDGHIVCMHDADTKRTTGVKKVVESSTLAELRRLDAGSWKGADWAGEPIPTFAEVYQTVPSGGWFVIELKSKRAIVPLLAEELRRLPREGRRLLIITFDTDTVRACREQIPDVPVQWLTSFKQNKLTRQFTPSAGQIAATVRDTGAEGVGMRGERAVIDAAFIERLAAGSCEKFHVWTVDDGDDARYFQERGAFAITTNRPAEIRAAIDNSSSGGGTE